MKSARPVFLSRIMLAQGVSAGSIRVRTCSYVNRAISCGVCGKMKTLSWGIGLETVAVGFSAASRYPGPRGCEGGCASEAILQADKKSDNGCGWRREVEDQKIGSEGPEKVTFKSLCECSRCIRETGGERTKNQPATSLVEKPRPVTIGGPRCVQSPPAAILRLVALVDPGAPRSQARSLSPATGRTADVCVFG
jgi:hypothetical protein